MAIKERVKRDGERQLKTARQICKIAVGMTAVTCKRIDHRCEGLDHEMGLFWNLVFKTKN